MRNRIRVAVSGIALLTTIAVVAHAASDKVFSHTVRQGESVSLICIDYYGYYGPALGTNIQKLNPGLKNINLIYTGQILRLPSQNQSAQAPASPAASTPASTPIPAASSLPRSSRSVAMTQGVVTWVEGNARITYRGTTTPASLVSNTVVSPGDILETGTNGRVEIIVNREAVVRMDWNSRLEFTAIRDAKKSGAAPTSFGFSLGTVWTKVKKFSDKLSRFQLELPTAIAGVHGTVYQTAVAADSTCDVKVFNGTVAVSNPPSPVPMPRETAGPHETSGPHETVGPHEVSMNEWIRIVKDMQQIHIDKQGNPSEPRSFTTDTTSDWVRWNRERDKRIAVMFGEEAR